MKKSTIIALISVIAVGAMSFSILRSNGNIPGRTNSPGETTCTGCHGGTALNAGPGSITITSSPSLASGYTAGTSYTITVTVAESVAPNNALFGVCAEALLASGANGGTIAITNATLTQLLTRTIGVNVRNSVTHTGTGNVGPNSQAFSFRWTAPVTGTGAVTFYAAGLACNNDGGSNGDHTYTTTLAVSESVSCTLAATSTKNDGCNNANNGTATASPTGGTPPYTYAWTGGQTTATATGLAPGAYTCTVTAGVGCTRTTTVSIVNPTVVVASVSSSTNVTCNGGSNGSATATGSGGTGAISYSWNTTPVQNTAIATGLTAGNYITTVTDANGCAKTASVTITQPAVVVASVSSSTNVTCNGGSNGSATATGSGGTGAISYSWNTTPVQNTAIATGLTAGNYITTVTDA
ncbi:MAG: hypothetical protein HY840_13315, partial [Bacteroidetes bacterium]|nr:hypothetical protein [Bacteroidota bacterium]